MKTGYTLVELMVTVTIITLLTSFGISAYSKAQTSQATRNATEAVLSALSSAQKMASSGANDCAAGREYYGQRVVFTSTKIQTSAACESSTFGAMQEITVSGVTFTTTPTLTFRPLNQGVQVSAEPTLINYTNGPDDYQIQVYRSGNIVNKGKQP